MATRYLAILLTMLAVQLTATAAEPRLDRAEPQGLRVGEELSVTFSGPRVGATPEELVFYESGIETVGLQSKNKNQVIAKVRLADDCSLGRHPVRLRTASGLSNLITLHVGVLESVAEAEPNNSIEKAQAIPLDRTVHGVVKAEDVDVFVVELGEGQRLSIEVEGLRLGRAFFDPVIELLDEAGQTLAKNDDQTAAHSDAFLTYVAAEAGKVYVRLRESAYRGDDRSTYLLHVGDFPRPTAVAPPVAKRGAETELDWVDAEGADSSVTVTADAEGLFEVHARDSQGVAPTGLPVWITPDTPAREVEPNDKRSAATPMSCPGVAAGIISQSGDRDHFRIQAKKKQRFDLRVRARQLRTPLDSVLRIYDAKGKRLDGNDDDRGHPDSYLSFEAPADGEYTLQVEDRLNRGGPAYGYALDVSPPEPHFEIKLDERRRYEATVLEVPRGGRTAALFTVTRRNVGGPLVLNFDHLPAGVTVESFPLAKDYNRVPVVLSATPDAELAATLSPLSAHKSGTENPEAIETRFEQQTWFVRGRNNRPVWSHFAKRAPVAVTQRVPFKLSLRQPKAPLCQNGSIDLTVTAKRDEGFDKSIAVRMLYHSPGVSSNRSRTIRKDATEASIPVTANGKARLGEWPIVVVGEVNLGGRVYTSTQFVQLEVKDAYFDLALPTATGKQGESIEWTAKLSPRHDFAGPAILRLVGLPPGASAEPVEIETGAESAAFQVKLAKDAKPGRHRGVGCRVELLVEEEPVTYRQAYAELRIDPAEPPPARTAARPVQAGGTAE